MNFEYDGQYDRLVLKVIRALIRKYNIDGNVIDEEDLLQEGRIGLLKALETYQDRGKAKFETYASAVIRNRVLDYLRSTKVDEQVPVETPVFPPDPVLWEILNKVLQEHCNQLERSIFNAYYKGYSYQEIGEIFEINKKKVDNTIQKILNLARSIYQN